MKIIVTIERKLVDFSKISQDIFKISTILNFYDEKVTLSVDSVSMKEFMDILIKYDSKIEKIIKDLNIVDNNYPYEIYMKDLISNSDEEEPNEEKNVFEEEEREREEREREEEGGEKEKENIYFEDGYREDEGVNKLTLFDDKLKIHISKIFKETISTSKRLEDLENKKKKLISELIAIEQSISDCIVGINSNKIIEKFVNDINKLKNIENVEEIYFTNDEIVIVTKELITQERMIDNNGELFHRKIGRMRIGINILLFFGDLHTTNNFITIHNLSRGFDDVGRVLECGHVLRNGSMCLGDIVLESLIKAFALKDIPMIYDVVIRFITQPNINDELGQQIVYFPNAV
jgi:hypothetical protein